MGFTAPVGGAPGLNFVLSHINTSPHRSPCLSFTTSYAIAHQYALFGPGGPATQASPGHVYVVDLSQLPAAAVMHFIDPIAEIATNNGGLAHCHNGGAGLVDEVAKSVTSYSLAIQRHGKRGPPMITPAFQAMVRAMRDAEILIYGSVQLNAVVDRDDIY